jgi:ABC-type multidrug transport system permease subunit
LTRERASKAYRLSSYYCAKVLAEIPLNMAASTVFCCVIYWIANLNR